MPDPLSRPSSYRYAVTRTGPCSDRLVVMVLPASTSFAVPHQRCPTAYATPRQVSSAVPLGLHSRHETRTHGDFRDQPSAQRVKMPRRVATSKKLRGGEPLARRQARPRPATTARDRAFGRQPDPWPEGLLNALAKASDGPHAEGMHLVQMLLPLRDNAGPSSAKRSSSASPRSHAQHLCARSFSWPGGRGPRRFCAPEMRRVVASGRVQASLRSA